MDKTRVVALADGIFAVAMTILIFDIKIPAFSSGVTDATLWHSLGILWPHVTVFALSFAVLSVMWVNHHFLFDSFAKEIDRRLNLINMLYLMFIAFVPFSASLIGEYSDHQPATIVYGVNLLLITLTSVWMVSYIKRTQGIEHLSDRLLNQSRFRSVLNILCYLFGIVVSFINVYVSLFFYIFPIIFNIIPGTLDFTEKLFRFSLGEKE